MSSDEVEVEGQRLRVRRTSSGRFRILTFTMRGRQFTAIEQNPDKPSQWAQLVRSGHQIVQLKDCASKRFGAVPVDRKINEYGAKKNSG